MNDIVGTVSNDAAVVICAQYTEAVVEHLANLVARSTQALSPKRKEPLQQQNCPLAAIVSMKQTASEQKNRTAVAATHSFSR